jgi:hypothetical protein
LLQLNRCDIKMSSNENSKGILCAVDLSIF